MIRVNEYEQPGVWKKQFNIFEIVSFFIWGLNIWSGIIHILSELNVIFWLKDVKILFIPCNQ